MSIPFDSKTYWRERSLRQRAERLAGKPADVIGLLEPTTLSYIAGLLDGEGCITIAKAYNKDSYVPSISFIMTHEGVLVWLAGQLGVICRPRKLKYAKPHWKPQFAVIVTGKRAVFLLKRLMPSLIVKKPQAELVVEFGETYAQLGEGSRRVSAEITARRVALKLRVASLNDRRRLNHHESK